MRFPSNSLALVTGSWMPARRSHPLAGSPLGGPLPPRQGRGEGRGGSISYFSRSFSTVSPVWECLSSVSLSWTEIPK